MRVLLLLPYAWDTAPSQRYRIEQWVPWLREQGVEFQVSTLLTAAEQRLLYSSAGAARKAVMMAGATLRRAVEVSRRRGFDLIWLHRAALPVGPPMLERWLARTRIPIVYEFDDAIFLTHTSAVNSRWGALKCAGKTGDLSRLAAHVVVGNDYLAEYARGFNPRTTIIPTTVDTTHYVPRGPHQDDGPVVIGWSGSGTTLPHLRTLEGVLRRVAREVPVRLQVIGVEDYALEGVPTSARAWRPETQVAGLQEFDIGVMPLPDDQFARGKCGCKALEYMAVEVPVVTSPVGVNAEIVQDDRNGLLAATEDEWVAKLVRLARDVELRRRLGRAGRETVEAHYSTAVVAPQVLELLRRVVSEATATAAGEARLTEWTAR